MCAREVLFAARESSVNRYPSKDEDDDEDVLAAILATAQPFPLSEHVPSVLRDWLLDAAWDLPRLWQIHRPPNASRSMNCDASSLSRAGGKVTAGSSRSLPPLLPALT